MASSSSSSISSTRRPSSSSYDVFINFRGPDTRKDFVFLLHKALKQDGIHAFKDSEDLWEGEEICPSLLSAIRGSKISIPVFSKKYAESKYCLMELAEIWDCHLSQAQTVLPVFIDVEPRDVGRQTESFEGPFQEHQRNYESAQVEKWRIALKKVGKIKGWTLKGDADIESQSDVVDLIVRVVLKELSSSTPLDECKYLIGIDSHVNALRSILAVGFHDIRFVAICGMGGLGKTTIAKVVYNNIFRNFSGSSFLANVREEASQGDKGLVRLQNQMFKDILKKEHDISNLFQGSKMIKERLCPKKVLIILDDVDDPKQIDALARGIDWFGQGSRVLITTRDEGSLTPCKFIQIYKPEKMDSEKSLQLFSCHCFSKKEPPEKYKELSIEIAQHADGLPLTLEVWGSFLIDKEIGEWEDTLRALEYINDGKVSGMPIKSYDAKVFRKLKISYDGLSDHAKIVFLDIACNLVGWKVDKAISIWEACELSPRLAIKELAQKHLIKILETTLTMHDQLRYMAREIISKDSGRDLTKCTRLWKCDEIMKLLKEDTGTSMVEGILLPLSARDDLSWEDFAKMTQLRFLSLSGSIYWRFDSIGKPINGDFLSLPSKLRWLSLYSGPLEILPANFYHKEIVHLELSSSAIKQAWNDIPRNENQRFQKLKVLIMSGCSALSRSPNFFAWFPCLEILDLTKCESLQELPDSICQMTSLKSLILNRCESIKKLPTRIADLTKLAKLSVQGTRIEELPDGVGQLEKLEELNTLYCSELGKLPTSMSRMRSLLRFYLKSPLALNLPDDFSKLSSLEVLEFHYCDKLTELPNLLSLQRLRVLLIRYNENITEIHGLHGAEFLEELNVEGCCKVTELPNLSALKRLRVLTISDCENLEEIHGLEGLESLENLTVMGCCKVRQLPKLSALKRLRVVEISYCENLEEIHGIGELESLQELKVYGCDKLTETTRKLHGQGRFKLDHVSEDEQSSSIAIDHGSVPILCVVFECEHPAQKGMKGAEVVELSIQSSIRFRGKEINCVFSIKPSVKINSRHAIYLHHFNFNGLFFQTEPAIEKLTVRNVLRTSWHFGTSVSNVQFWKVFSENKESFQQIPNQQSSAKLVEDFFDWSDTDGDEEEKMLQESKKSLIHYDDDDETAGPSLMEGFDSNHGFTLQKTPSQQPDIEEEEEEEERNNIPTVHFLSRLRFNKEASITSCLGLLDLKDDWSNQLTRRK